MISVASRIYSVYSATTEVNHCGGRREFPSSLEKPLLSESTVTLAMFPRWLGLPERLYALVESE